MSFLRRRSAVRAFGLFIGVLLSGLAGTLWIEWSQASRIYGSAERSPTRTVAIVPGARVHVDGRPFAVLEDRLACARDLYRSGRVGRILVSGDHRQEGYDEVNGMHAWLVRQGVPTESIFLDHAGLRTLDTMERAARVFQVRDAAICTQRFHLARSLFLAREAGIDAVGVVADRRAYLHAWRFQSREHLARIAAVLDAFVLDRKPEFLGPVIPIEGDSRLSHDKATQRASR